jgi:peptidoglycan hydrolase CwlO-like protein
MGTENEVNPIESKELRGISIKALAWLLGSTITIVISVMTSYFTLSSKIDTLQRDKAADERYNDLKLQTMQVQIQGIEARIENMSNEIKSNKTRIQNVDGIK